MHYIDDEILEQAAREALERPSNSAMWDDRLYTTHAPILSWAENSGDLLDESNYKCVLDQLVAEAHNVEHLDEDTHEWAECCRQEGSVYPNHGVHEDYVIDAPISDWLVGPLRQLFVQVYEPDGSFTPVWREAVSIGLALRDYPVYDESDYSEREWEAFMDTLEEALDFAERQVWHEAEAGEEDDDATVEAVKRGVREVVQDAGQWCRSEDVDWDMIEQTYREIRGTLVAV